MTISPSCGWVSLVEAITFIVCGTMIMNELSTLLGYLYINGTSGIGIYMFYGDYGIHIYGLTGMSELAKDMGYIYHFSRLIPCLIGLYSILPNGEYQSIVWSYYGE
jgi:hypothetical protein